MCLQRLVFEKSASIKHLNDFLITARNVVSIKCLQSGFLKRAAREIVLKFLHINLRMNKK